MENRWKTKITFFQTTSDQVFCYIAGVKCKLRYTVFVHSYIMKSPTALITEGLCSVVYIRCYLFSEHYVEQIKFINTYLSINVPRGFMMYVHSSVNDLQYAGRIFLDFFSRFLPLVCLALNFAYILKIFVDTCIVIEKRTDLKGVSGAIRKVECFVIA